MKLLLVLLLLLPNLSLSSPIFTVGALPATSGGESAPFPHFWELGINSPHSAIALRSDWRDHMTMLKQHNGYKYTRLHAPFSRDFSFALSANETSYYNAFSVYDCLLSQDVKPWIELGYAPCYMSGPAAVPMDSYWPTVDYGICVGPPTHRPLTANPNPNPNPNHKHNHNHDPDWT